MALSIPERKRVLVTGAGGLLGSNFVLIARDRHDVTALCGRNLLTFGGVKTVQADLQHSSEVATLLRQERPDCIVHLAAATNVDECEANPEFARSTNVVSTELLARWSAENRVPIVYMSTDSVFDGRTGGYREEDGANPINVYAATKLEGERVIRGLTSRHLIIRANIYGWNALPKRSLAEWILDRLESGQRVPGFVDAVFAPLLVNTLSEAILKLMECGAVGTYHLAAAEAVSKYEFARRLARVFGFSEGLVDESQTGLSLKAPRPLKTWLRPDKVVREFGMATPSVDQDLIRFRDLRDNGYLQDLKATYT